MTRDIAGTAPLVTTAARQALPGMLAAVIVLCVYGGLALSVDFPRASMGIQSDEATYYMMGHSLAEDGDLAYRRADLMRVWEEFPTGPNGVFLKRGRDIVDAGLMMRPPFFWTTTAPDLDQARLFYGKAFIYPLVASPLVKVFGTNGFLILNALLLAFSVWCGYLFLQARMAPAIAAVLAAAFVMASVVPVYFVWITPELFNFALGLFAYFCWLYKEVARPEEAGRWTRWLFGPYSDVVAALLIGILTFSKVTNALLFVPIPVWLAWRRRWGAVAATGATFAFCAAGLFLVNTIIVGEWNYQGGERNTFVGTFPFQSEESTFAEGLAMARNESQADVIFDRRVFWTNLTHNLRYYFVGRYSGLVAYFFPAVFALIAYLAAPRRRPGWQHLVFAAGVAQILLFVITLPYTWFGGGGSVGNRYFMGVYGIFLFLLPPISRTWVAVIPWIVGGLFMAKLVFNPFMASIRPGEYARSGPLRLLPVELTNINDLPINTDAARVRVWFGDNPGQGDPGFQIYFLDDKAYDREADKSVWVKGESRTEFLIKTDRPMRRLMLTLSAGPVATTARATVAGRTQEVTLGPGEFQLLRFQLDEGFPYQARSFVWPILISSSSGFTPIFYGSAHDTRYLGVRAKPVLVE